MGAVISTEEPVRSVSGAEGLLARHSEYKAEIDAREESVMSISKVGRRLSQQGHFASTEVKGWSYCWSQWSVPPPPPSRSRSGWQS